MVLKFVVDDIESVPESLRGEYVERAGKYHLNVEGMDLIKSENVALRAELDQANELILRTGVANALAEAGVTDEGRDLLQERLLGRVRFDVIDGEKAITVMQADGKTLMAGSGSGKRATLAELAGETAAKYPSMFRQGGGSGPKAGGVQEANVLSRKEFDSLSPTEQAAKMRAGFRLVDSAGPPKLPKSSAASVKVMARKDFSMLSPADQMARMKAGFTLRD
jgi:hypothetical protein